MTHFPIGKAKGGQVCQMFLLEWTTIKNAFSFEIGKSHRIASIYESEFQRNTKERQLRNIYLWDL